MFSSLWKYFSVGFLASICRHSKSLLLLRLSTNSSVAETLCQRRWRVRSSFEFSTCSSTYFSLLRMECSSRRGNFSERGGDCPVRRGGGWAGVLVSVLLVREGWARWILMVVRRGRSRTEGGWLFSRTCERRRLRREKFLRQRALLSIWSIPAVAIICLLSPPPTPTDPPKYPPSSGWFIVLLGFGWDCSNIYKRSMMEEPERESLVGLDAFGQRGEQVGRGILKGEEQEDSLIGSEGVAARQGSAVSVAGEVPSRCLDAVEELVSNSNVMPLLAVLDRVDLNITIQGKPLLSRLCTMNIPLQNHLHARTVSFLPDEDNRTALHDAIAADDTLSAHWCMSKGIANSRDNMGNTPILEAIQLGRRSCFLLCLQFDYYDSEAPQVCAKYNRVWELKVLRAMGYDVLATRDSEHFTAVERAVQFYAYDAAEYLGRVGVGAGMEMEGLESRTDSKGIIRLVRRVREEESYVNRVVKSIAYPLVQMLWIYGFTSGFEAYQASQAGIHSLMGVLLLLYTCLVVFGCSSSSQRKQKPDLMRLLKAPEFPVLQDICPQCLEFADPNKDHCNQCGICIENYHFHSFVCVNKRNQIFWMLLEITWLSLSLQLLAIFSKYIKFTHLLVLGFSNNPLFTAASIFQMLVATSWTSTLWFVYLLLSVFYRTGRCLQWTAMLLLDRTYQQINHTQRYKKLYEIVRTKDGGYKNAEVRLMRDGLCVGVRRAVVNAVRYFWK